MTRTADGNGEETTEYDPERLTFKVKVLLKCRIGKLKLSKESRSKIPVEMYTETRSDNFFL